MTRSKIPLPVSTYKTKYPEMKNTIDRGREATPPLQEDKPKVSARNPLN